MAGCRQRSGPWQHSSSRRDPRAAYGLHASAVRQHVCWSAAAATDQPAAAPAESATASQEILTARCSAGATAEDTLGVDRLRVGSCVRRRCHDAKKVAGDWEVQRQRARLPSRRRRSTAVAWQWLDTVLNKGRFGQACELRNQGSWWVIRREVANLVSPPLKDRPYAKRSRRCSV